MALPSTDIQSGQPIKTWSNGDVVSAICDGTTNSQLLGVDSAGRITSKLYDGGGNAVTSQVNGAQRALDVGINVAGIQIDPRQVGTYNSVPPTLLSGSFAPVELDVNGRTIVVSPAAANFLATVTQGTSPWIASDLADGPVTPGIAAAKSMLGGGVYNSSAPTLTNGQQAALQMDSTGALKIRLLTDADRVSADLAVAGAAVSPTNPVPVTITSTTPGTPINNYYASPANVLAGASDTHTYTVTTGKTFNGKKFFASGSGHMRIDVNTVIGGVTSTVFTAFNSISNPNISIDMDQFYLPDSGTTAQIQIVRYNEEKTASFGMFSTISGTEN